MATLHAVADGVMSSASTWALCNSTAEQDGTETITVNIPITVADSSTFTPGAITVDGIGLKVTSVAASPTGTVTITLRNSTDAVDAASITINANDLVGFPTAGAVTCGWTFFKFASSVTLIAGKAYTVRLV